LNKAIVFVLIIGVFLLGWLSNSAYSDVFIGNVEIPYSLSSNTERDSPSDWIKQDQIHVYNDKIVIDLIDAEWAEFEDTNSMDPIIDVSANSIEIKPKNPEFLQVGDIVSYRSKYADGLIIHRIHDIGYDADGWYAILKGDNNPRPDPGKIRFDQIEGVLVGVLY
jgi:hypothetical protein